LTPIPGAKRFPYSKIDGHASAELMLDNI